MTSPTRLVLIRHGEIESRYHRVFGGRIDMGLSPFGREQASALALYLERIRFDRIYASPMKRVRQTLEAIIERQDHIPTILPQLREVDFGVWTGLSWEEVKEKYAFSAFQWLHCLENGQIEGAESVDEFRARVADALNVILSSAAEKTVAIICHGGVIRMLLSLLLNLPLIQLAAFEVEYAGLSIISSLPGRTELELMNFTPWRDLA